MKDAMDIVERLRAGRPSELQLDKSEAGLLLARFELRALTGRET